MINISLITKIQQQHPQVKLIGVTKNQSVETTKSLLETGLKSIGENRIQEAREKFTQLPTSTEKHLIGHLQRNKAKVAIQLFDMIQSIDSWRIAEKVNEEAAKVDKNMPVLLQVNIAQDAKKYGFHPQELIDLLPQIQALPYLSPRGLMTIVPHYDNAEDARADFQALKALQNKLLPDYPELSELSMGMSNDYPIAIEEGATMVRIGRALFGNV